MAAGVVETSKATVIVTIETMTAMVIVEMAIATTEACNGGRGTLWENHIGIETTMVMVVEKHIEREEHHLMKESAAEERR